MSTATDAEQPKPKPASKWKPGERSLSDILTDLRQPLAPALLGTSCSVSRVGAV